MKFTKQGAEIYVPDSTDISKAVARTTHIGVSAHPNDLEIMAFDGIMKCFGNAKNWFSGVNVMNGEGNSKIGRYASYSDEQMRSLRKAEQKKAAVIGGYGSMVFLNYSSSEVNDPENKDPARDLRELFEESRPSVVYTHNLADRHETHVAVAVRTIRALRKSGLKPTVYGCEVWGDLDWLPEADKVAFNVSGHENLAYASLGVFDSQIAGGKRYDLATMGRRRSNATYHNHDAVDSAKAIIYAMDLTPLVSDPKLDIGEYVAGYLKRFRRDVLSRIESVR